jgi:hypothetical protein
MSKGEGVAIYVKSKFSTSGILSITKAKHFELLAVKVNVYSAFRKYSDPLTFFTFGYVTALFRNGLNHFPPSSIYTQYPIMTKLEMFWGNTEILHLHKYSDPLLSILLKCLWQRLQPEVFLDITLQTWHTCIWGVSSILLCISSQGLSAWMGSSQLFSVL